MNTRKFLLVLWLIIPLSAYLIPNHKVEAKPSSGYPAAYYSSIDYSNLFGMEPSIIQSFTDIRNGVTILQDGVFLPQTSGLIRVTVHCEMKSTPIFARLVLTPLDTPYFTYHAEGVEIVELTAVIDAGPFTVAGWQEGVGAMRSRCTISVEDLK